MWQDKETAYDVSAELKTGKSIALDDDSPDGVDPALRDAFVSGIARSTTGSRLPKEFTGMPNGH